MRRQLHPPREDGFTLPELLVAITILGIIIVAIGAMITTSFRTSTIVSAELQGSRGPKVVSRYWVPDAEQATGFTSGGGCVGAPGTPIATFTSPVYPSAFDQASTPAPSPPPSRSITWSVATTGRTQLVRTVCDPGSQPQRTVVVSDLQGTPSTSTSAPPRYVISVSVPDHTHDHGLGIYTFDVAGTSQVTTTTSRT